ncbi:MAG TPA: hypothetical protein VJR25_09730, partial [Microbacterium sp.]|uniref:glycosylhydrolase-like jelly roll fold domain-containing protein n=1 Tax=Microbacterium sp. TaxID=51671 RepID=UPI002B469987
AAPASAGDVAVPLDLAPGEATVLIVGDPAAWRDVRVLPALTAGAGAPIAPTWTVETATAEEHPAFTPWRTLDELVPLDAPGLLPRFSGTVRYTASFDADAAAGSSVLDLGAVHEIAQVAVNGVDLGTRIAPPYRFEIPAGVLAAGNTLQVEVTNTLVKAQPDFFSAFVQQEPTGLLGPVVISPLHQPEETTA